jgi:Cu/Ag efflux protein CusF
MEPKASVVLHRTRDIRFASVVALSVALAGAPAALAQGDDHRFGHIAQAAAASTADTAEGEVRKVDKAAAKITLKHGELKALDMPPMTMVFQVKDKSLLDKVKQGDKVRFTAEKIGGQFTVTEIEPVR